MLATSSWPANSTSSMRCFGISQKHCWSLGALDVALHPLHHSIVHMLFCNQIVLELIMETSQVQTHVLLHRHSSFCPLLSRSGGGWLMCMWLTEPLSCPGWWLYQSHHEQSLKESTIPTPAPSPLDGLASCPSCHLWSQCIRTPLATPT